MFHYVPLSRCLSSADMTRPQGGRVHYTHAVAEASYDGAQLSSMLIDID